MMMIISKKELTELVKACYELAALHSGGVDNWAWCGESVSDFLDRYWMQNHDALIKFFNLTTEEEIEEFKEDVKEAVEDIKEEVKEYADEIYTDALGNLICRKKGNGKKVMFASHMDEIGIVVTFIDEKGFLRFADVGGLYLRNLINRRVRFENGTIGVIGTEENNEKRQMSKMFIDIGAKDREDAEKMVFTLTYKSASHGKIQGKAVVFSPYKSIPKAILQSSR